MGISGMEGMSNDQINFELQRGAKIVRYYYCVSVLVLTYRGARIYFVKDGENRFLRGLPFTLLSLVAGWWGIPWGPIRTVQSLVVNCGGGKDITAEVLNGMAARSAAAGAITR